MSQSGFRNLLCAVAVSLLFVSIAPADRLPDDQLASGKPETTLARLDLSKDTNISQAIELYGKPLKKDTSPDKTDWTGYSWDTRGTVIEIDATKGIMNRVYIHGNTNDTITGTGAGLKLGDTLRRFKHFYGKKFAEQKAPVIKGGNKSVPTHEAFSGVSELHQATVEWKDKDYKLTAGFDEKGKIVSLLLARPE